MREGFQREAIGRALTGSKDEDLILISDADEIPRRDVVARLRQDRRDLFGLRMPLFYLRFNYLNTSGAVHETLCIAIRRRGFRSANGVRSLRAGFCSPIRRLRYGIGFAPDIPDAGWHFSYFGDEAAVKLKFRSVILHGCERDCSRRIDDLDIPLLLEKREDLFLRPGFRWELVRLDSYFPRYLLEHQTRFVAGIAPGASASMADFQTLLAREASGLYHSFRGLKNRLGLAGS
jgi:hypothetical protein